MAGMGQAAVRGGGARVARQRGGWHLAGATGNLRRSIAGSSPSAKTGLPAPGGMRSLYDLGEAKIAGVVVLVVAVTGAGRGAVMTNAAMKEIVVHVINPLCGTATIVTTTVSTELAADVGPPRRGLRRQDAGPLHRLRPQGLHRPCGAHHQLLPAVAGQLGSSNQMFSRMRTAMM